MHKRYLLYANLPYTYPILRPLQQAIRQQGDEAAWFIEPNCTYDLTTDELQLHTFEEVQHYQPLAIFAPGNYIPDFLPGIKVALFHGYAIAKRYEQIDDHFTIRGWFDIYCTQGESSTPYFRELEAKHKYFKVYETGWTKADTYFSNAMQTPVNNKRPLIIYAPTFTKNVCSAPHIIDELRTLVKSKPWDWIITFHPKLTNPDIHNAYQQLVADNDNVTFLDCSDKLPWLHRADIMLCDSSSIILEFMFFGKPVVTFRNSHPGDHLINVTNPKEIGNAIEQALTHPQTLMQAIERYTYYHEPHRDGLCSQRVLQAVDDFSLNYQGKLPAKPRNLIRKIKLRRQLGYPILKDL